ncbi:MAG: oligoribonuclease [Thermodesulfobacteriota bacterium]
MDDKLIWMDLEMTGLDPETAVIVEIATVVTDKDLAIVAEGPVMAIALAPEDEAAMDEWSREHHEASGLMDRVRASRTSAAEAEERTLAFLSGLCQEKACPLCGNSVWQDRRFLVKYMPRLNEFLHHRLVDVSTVKELARRWLPGLAPYAKKHSHTAREDILESINELAYYRDKVFLAAKP